MSMARPAAETLQAWLCSLRPHAGHLTESLNARPAAETLQVWLHSLRSCIQESGTVNNYRPYLSTLLCATVMHIILQGYLTKAKSRSIPVSL